MGGAGVSPVRQHKVDQAPVLVDSPEQVLPLATNLYIRLVHSPGGRTVALISAHPLLQFRSKTMHPAHDRGRVYLYTAFLHHLRQISIADPIFAIPAYTDQDDLDRKTTTLEHGMAPRSTAPDYDMRVNATEPVVLSLYAFMSIPERVDRY